MDSTWNISFGFPRCHGKDLIVLGMSGFGFQIIKEGIWIILGVTYVNFKGCGPDLENMWSLFF